MPLIAAVLLAACSGPVGGTDALLLGEGRNSAATPAEGLYMSVLDDLLPPDASDEIVGRYRTLPDLFCERLRDGAPYELSEAAVTKGLVDAGISLPRSQELALRLHFAGTRWRCPELVPAGLFD